MPTSNFCERITWICSFCTLQALASSSIFLSDSGSNASKRSFPFE